jgi:arginyl-tRNA synthetase
MTKDINFAQFYKKLTTEFAFEWSVPEIKFGLLSTNEAFKMAKELRQNPNIIAQNLRIEIQDFLTREFENSFEAVQVGPYINIKIANYDFLNFEISLEKNDQKLLLEYVSPNVAKPLHAGHIRNANYGEVLRRVLSLKYAKLETMCYWGDWGVQFGVIIWAWKQLEIQKEIMTNLNGEELKINLNSFEKNPIETMVGLYVWGSSQKEEFETQQKAEFMALEKGENRDIWQKLLVASKQNVIEELGQLGLPEFDYHWGESYYEDEMESLEVFFEEKNLWQKEEQNDGISSLARFVQFDSLEFFDEKRAKQLGRMYLKSSQGYTSYAFRDVAARILWAKEIGADLAITITANEQIHHFEQFIAYLEYLKQTDVFIQKFGDLKINPLHLSYGFLTLPEGKMSTRKGLFVTAENTISQVKQKVTKILETKNGNTDSVTVHILAIAALKWYDLSKNCSSDVVLNMEEMLSFEGNTGIYQLYTIARINSIFDKIKTDVLPDFETLNDLEKLILTQIFGFSQTIERVATDYKPHYLCTHLFELCQNINSWYSKYSISKETDQTRQATMLLMLQLTKQNIKKSLTLLGIQTLDSF